MILLSPWEEDNMMNPNMGGMGMKMNFNDNNPMNFYGQDKRGTKKQPRKGNNKQGNPNFNKPGSGFDPMAFQNPIFTMHITIQEDKTWGLFKTY